MNTNQNIIIEIDMSEDEFTRKCVDFLLSNKFNTGDSILHTVDYCFERALGKVEGINKVTFIDRLGNGTFKGVDPNFDDYITKGGFYLPWYKLDVDCLPIVNMSGNSIILPHYMSLENNFHGQPEIYIRKKALKTKSHYIIQFVRIKVCKDILVKARDLLPEHFFVFTPYLGGYKRFASENVSASEKLPYPIVLYPSALGSFIGFKRDINDKTIYFCSCMREALKNCVEMSILEKDRKRILFNNVPIEMQDILNLQNNENINNIMNSFNFADSLCHECNMAIPTYYYYIMPTEFSKIYGWYVKKQFFEYGILDFYIFFGIFYSKLILKDKCPSHIIGLFDFELIESLQELSIINKKENLGKLYNERSIEIKKKIEIMNKRIHNAVEDDVRVKFGYHKIGEEWVNETSLFYQLKQEFPDLEIVHHGRPEWLGKQHLDIWMPNWKIAIEYQGAQHFQAIERFGGEEGLLKTQERDEKKAELCKKNNVELILVNEGYFIGDVIAKIKEVYRKSSKNKIPKWD